MRVVRTILGILLLTIGLPLLLAGGGLWTAMQHRDAGGAFSGALEKMTNTGYAVVVPDVDGLLRREAPFTRSDNTRLRITAQTTTGPAFIGMRTVGGRGEVPRRGRSRPRRRGEADPGCAAGAGRAGGRRAGDRLAGPRTRRSGSAAARARWSGARRTCAASS